MANLIPNENTFVGFIVGTGPKPDGVTNISAPTVAEVASAVDITDYVVSLTASSTGGTVPTPRLKRLFETSIPGTTTATFTIDLYRDDEDDLAYETLQKGVRGSFIVQRFGGTGTGGRPVATQVTEVWPVIVVSAADSAMTSGTALTFTVTCSVPKEPDQTATVAA